MVSDAAVSFGVLTAILAGATLYFQLTGQRPLAPAPRIAVSIDVLGGPGKALSERPMVRPDVIAILDHECEAASRSLPAVPPNLSVLAASTMSHPSKADRARFLRKLAAYRSSLAQWLRDYPADTWPARAAVDARFEIRNESSVPAESLRVTLTLSDGIKPCCTLDGPTAPPERPEWRSPLAMRAGSLGRLAAIMPTLDTSIETLDPDGENWTWTQTAGLLHGHSSTTSLEARIVVPEPGTYTVHWTAWAANLPSPSTGTCELTVQAPTQSITATSVAELWPLSTD